MTEQDVRKAVLLLDLLPAEVNTSVQSKLTAEQREVIDTLRARHIEGSPEDRAAAVADFLAASLQVRAQRQADFRALARCDAVTVTLLLADEHPQVIALVLSRLPASLAAEVLSSLAAELRAEVARRIAALEAVSEEVVCLVAAALTERLAALPTTRCAKVDGVAALGKIFQSLDDVTEEQLLDRLAYDEPRLAQALARQSFSLEDVLQMSAANVQILVANVDTAPLAVALKSATAETRRKILELLPTTFAERLREAVAHLGLLPRATVDQAHLTIADVLARLQESGRIRSATAHPIDRRVA